MTLIKHHDPVASLHGAESVGNHQNSFITWQGIDGFHHFCLCQIVERACSLVEHNEIRIVIKRPRNSDALALPTREAYAALTDMRLISIR